MAGSGSGSIPLTIGSGSGRTKNMWIRWIRIQIRNAGSFACQIFRSLEIQDEESSKCSNAKWNGKIYALKRTSLPKEGNFPNSDKKLSVFKLRDFLFPFYVFYSRKRPRCESGSADQECYSKPVFQIAYSWTIFFVTFFNVHKVKGAFLRSVCCWGEPVLEIRQHFHLLHTSHHYMIILCRFHDYFYLVSSRESKSVYLFIYHGISDRKSKHISFHNLDQFVVLLAPYPINN